MLEDRRKRTKWFLEDRFGIFIHWGLYAIPARGEWIMTNEKISKEDYRVYFDEFDPVDYNPKAWARAAKKAGMKYAVMTAKHHDGFCLFDSKLTDYKATNTKAARDLVKEYIEAFRAEGLKVGLYYSVIDWHHQDFPHYGDRHHPERDNEDYKGRKHDFENYLKYMHGQVEELCTNYGDIDILWFDFSYDDMVGEKWEASELIKMVRSHQPNVIIDNRLEASGENSGSIMTRSPSFYAGDFASPEQIIPPSGIVDEDGNPVPWEACITMNNHWGYCSSDKSFKSSKMIIRKLVECVSKNGNLLLNVGPNARGQIPGESLEILAQIGNWMKDNGDSIYRAGKSELNKPEWGYYTQKDNKLYAHIFEASIGPLAIAIPSNIIRKARLLADGSEIKLIRPWNTMDYNDHAFINFGSPEHLTYPLPNDIDTVVELTLDND
ncbi:MAG: alpha-L-fucosidase [Tissierellia bacterium]|nr:alpha-L-fucosidase [Tissierellia bacterium]